MKEHKDVISLALQVSEHWHVLVNHIDDVFVSVVTAGVEVCTEPCAVGLFVSDLSNEVAEVINDCLSLFATLWVFWYFDSSVTTVRDIIIEH